MTKARIYLPVTASTSEMPPKMTSDSKAPVAKPAGATTSEDELAESEYEDLVMRFAAELQALELAEKDDSEDDDEEGSGKLAGGDEDERQWAAGIKCVLCDGYASEAVMFQPSRPVSCSVMDSCYFQRRE